VGALELPKAKVLSRWWRLPATPFVLFALMAVSYAQAIVVPIVAAVVAAVCLWRRRSRVGVRVDHDGVHQGGRVVVRRGDIIAIREAPRVDGTEITFVGRGVGATRSILVEDENVRAVLEALGRPAIDPPLRFECKALGVLATGMRLLLIALGVALFFAVRGVAMWGPWFFFTFPPTTSVDVGTDGVVLRLLGVSTFVAYAEIDEVTHAGWRVVLRLRSGKNLTLSLDKSLRGSAIAARIQEAMEKAHRPPEAPIPSNLPHEVARLRNLAESADYRAAPPARDVLWRVVVDPAAPAPTRARAAVALSSSLDPNERVRLRVVAEGTASPKLRVAIDAAAEEETDEAKLEALLASVQ
jgi:hypothetical protein